MRNNSKYYLNDAAVLGILLAKFSIKKSILNFMKNVGAVSEIQIIYLYTRISR